MGTYTVQPGDTLSGIGAKEGVDWHSITGYASGNPNLIQPGENLTWGDPTPTAAPAAPAPAAAPDPNSVSGLTSALGSFDASAQNPTDIYNAALNNLGITDARTSVTNLRQALLNNTNLLNALPGDISQRTSGALVTEAQRQRLVGEESAPITASGNQINQQYGTAQANETDIENQAKTQSDLQVQGQTAQRQALLDRLNLAIQQSDDAEKQREWQATYDEQVKQDQASAAKSSSTSSSKSKTASQSDINSYLQQAFTGYNPAAKDSYTEKVVIPAVMSDLGLSAAQAATQVYNYRKAVFNE